MFCPFCRKSISGTLAEHNRTCPNLDDEDVDPDAPDNPGFSWSPIVTKVPRLLPPQRVAAVAGKTAAVSSLRTAVTSAASTSAPLLPPSSSSSSSPGQHVVSSFTHAKTVLCSLVATLHHTLAVFPFAKHDADALFRRRRRTMALHRIGRDR